MTRADREKARRAIAFGQEAARSVDRLLDIYQFAAVALQLWPRTMAALERAERRIAYLERGRSADDVQQALGLLLGVRRDR
jgi:hypothetical protein